MVLMILHHSPFEFFILMGYQFESRNITVVDILVRVEVADLSYSQSKLTMTINDRCPPITEQCV